MRTRFADLLMYAVLSGVAGIVIWQTSTLPNPFGGTIGSGGFPTLMSIIALVLCAIGAFRSIVGEAGPRLEMPGLRKTLITLAATIALLVLWQVVGYFFFLGFIYLAGLLTLYAADEKLTARAVAIIVACSAVVMVLIYLFFTQVLYVRF